MSWHCVLVFFSFYLVKCSLFLYFVLPDWWIKLCVLRLERPGQAAAPPSLLLAVPNVTSFFFLICFVAIIFWWIKIYITAHSSAASVPTSYYSMWHEYLALWRVKRAGRGFLSEIEAPSFHHSSMAVADCGDWWLGRHAKPRTWRRVKTSRTDVDWRWLRERERERDRDETLNQ